MAFLIAGVGAGIILASWFAGSWFRRVEGAVDATHNLANRAESNAGRIAALENQHREFREHLTGRLDDLQDLLKRILDHLLTEGGHRGKD